MSTGREAEIRQVSARFYAAVNQVQQGEPGPMIALWSHAQDVTNMGPQGGRQEGWEAVRAYWEEAARRAVTSNAQVTAAAGDFLICVAGDLAYTCGTEHVRIVGDGEVSEIEPRDQHLSPGGWDVETHPSPRRRRLSAPSVPARACAARQAVY